MKAFRKLNFRVQNRTREQEIAKKKETSDSNDIPQRSKQQMRCWRKFQQRIYSISRCDLPLEDSIPKPPDERKENSIRKLGLYISQEACVLYKQIIERERELIWEMGNLGKKQKRRWMAQLGFLVPC